MWAFSVKTRPHIMRLEMWHKSQFPEAEFEKLPKTQEILALLLANRTRLIAASLHWQPHRLKLEQGRKFQPQMIRLISPIISGT